MAVHYPSYPTTRNRPLPAVRARLRSHRTRRTQLSEVAACAAFGLFVVGMLLAFSALMAPGPAALG